MALLKVTLLIKLATNTTAVNDPRKRIAGWTESYLGEDVTDPLPAGRGRIGSKLTQLCVLRAALLPTSGVIYGQRAQVINPVGQSTTYSNVYPGTTNLPCDAPQMALIGRAKGSGVINSREVNFRGLPDARQVEGEYDPSDSFDRALTAFFAYLRFYKFKARDLSQPAFPIINVLADGTYSTEGASNYVAHDVIRLVRCRNSEGERQKGGRFVVGTAISPSSGQLLAYDGVVRVGGKIRKEATVYPSFDGQKPGLKTGVRKVGRPQDLYHGRASAATR